MKYKIYTLLLAATLSMPAQASFLDAVKEFFSNKNETVVEEKVVRMASMPTFGALQPISYEIMKRIPENAKKYGLNVRVEPTKVKNSIDGNAFLMNGQLDVNVGSLSSLLTLHAKAPDSGRIIAGLGYYRFMLMCQDSVKDINDVLNTKIVVSSRKTMENHVLRWIAKKELGNPEAFEKNVILMTRPQIYQLFKANSEDVKCVITGTPLQNQLLHDFNLKVIDQSDLEKGMAGSYSIFWTTTKWANENPELARVVVETTVEVIQDYNKNPKPMLDYFIETDRMETTAETMLEYEKDNLAKWHSHLRGAEAINSFLYDTGYLTKNRVNDVESLILYPDLLDYSN
jgi:ABC-type nitrate/sulfonate/bicarbonate transport system substrate-binding protein